MWLLSTQRIIWSEELCIAYTNKAIYGLCCPITNKPSEARPASVLGPLYVLMTLWATISLPMNKQGHFWPHITGTIQWQVGQCINPGAQKASFHYLLSYLFPSPLFESAYLGPPHTFLTHSFFTEKATDGSLQSEDWALNMEICDIINETEEG